MKNRGWGLGISGWKADHHDLEQLGAQCHWLNWVLVIALLFLFACTCLADEPSARIAVIDAQITARQASRPELPDDLGGGGGGRDRGQNGGDVGDVGSKPLKVEAGESLLSTLRETLGPDGSVTLNPKQPIVIVRPEAKITIQRGTEIDYQLGHASGVLLFPKVKPQVEGTFLGMRWTPYLTRLDLAADNSGTVHAASNGIKLPPRRFKLGWDDVARATDGTNATNVIGPTGPSSPLNSRVNPITFYSSQGCGPCVTDKALLANSPLRDLVRIVEIDQVPHRHVGANGKPYTIFGTPTFIWTGTDGIDHNVFSFAELQRYWGQR